MTKEELKPIDVSKYTVTESGNVIKDTKDKLKQEAKEYATLQEQIAELEKESKLVKSLLYCTKRTCDNCGFVKCENFQRQRKSVPCDLYISLIKSELKTWKTKAMC